MSHAIRKQSRSSSGSSKALPSQQAKDDSQSKSGEPEEKILVRETISDYLKNHPCISCGETDPIVLEFDHRIHDEKKFNIGNACNEGLTLKKLLVEIAKCDVLCANCHRRKTYKERGYTHKG